MPGQLVFFGASSASRSTILSFSVLVAQVLWAVTLGWMVQLVVDVGRTPPTYLQDTDYSTNNTNWYAQRLAVAPPVGVLLLSFGVLYLAVATATASSNSSRSNTSVNTTAYFQLDPQMPPPTLRGTIQLAGPVAVLATLLWTLSNTSHDALFFSCLSVAISAFGQSLYLLGLEQVVRYQLLHHSSSSSLSADTTSNTILSLVHELWVDPAVCEAVFVYSLLQTPQTSLVLANTSSGNLTIQQLETLAAEWAVDCLDNHAGNDALEHTVWQCALLDALAAQPSKPQRNRQQHINVHWRETMYRALCVYVCGMGHVLVRCSNSNTSSISHQEHSSTRWNHIAHTTTTWVCPPALWYACTRAVHALRHYCCSNNGTTAAHHLGHDLTLARHSVQTLQQAVVGLQQKQQQASSSTVLANSNNTMVPQIVFLLRECRTVLETFSPPSSRQ